MKNAILQINPAMDFSYQIFSYVHIKKHTDKIINVLFVDSMVETRGVEPLSASLFPVASTCVANCTKISSYTSPSGRLCA